MAGISCCVTCCQMSVSQGIMRTCAAICNEPSLLENNTKLKSNWPLTGQPTRYIWAFNLPSLPSWLTNSGGASGVNFLPIAQVNSAHFHNKQPLLSIFEHFADFVKRSAMKSVCEEERTTLADSGKNSRVPFDVVWLETWSAANNHQAVLTDRLGHWLFKSVVESFLRVKTIHQKNTPVIQYWSDNNQSRLQRLTTKRPLCFVSHSPSILIRSQISGIGKWVRFWPNAAFSWSECNYPLGITKKWKFFIT